MVVERRRASASPSNHSALRHPGRTHPSNTCRANRAASPSARNVGYIQLCVWAGGLGFNLSVGPLFTAWRLGTLVSERCPAPQWEGLIVRRESILARIGISQMFLVVALNNTLYARRFYFTGSIKWILIGICKLAQHWERCTSKKCNFFLQSNYLVCTCYYTPFFAIENDKY